MALDTRARRHPRLGLAGAVWLLCLAACAHTHGGASAPLALSPVPGGRDARATALAATGHGLYRALSAGRLDALVVDELDLRALVDGASATRFAARRRTLALRLGIQPEAFTPFRQAEYAGVCVQGARAREGGGVLGLLGPTWTADRILVVGRRPGGRRLAAWLEGVFVFTNGGFVALDLNRVEAPRWEHSDLELANCDLEVGIH